VGGVVPLVEEAEEAEEGAGNRKKMMEGLKVKLTPQNVLIRFLFGCAFFAFGLVFLYLSTHSMLECKRDEAGEVTCRLERRLFGFLPLWRKTATHVQSAREYIYSLGGARIKAFGNTSYLVLVTDKGEVHLKYRTKSFSSAEVNDINQFLKNKDEKSWREARQSDRGDKWIGEIAGTAFAGLGLLCYLGLLMDGVLLILRRGKRKKVI